MSERTATVTIEGFGPVTFKRLSDRAWRDLTDKASGDLKVLTALLIDKALVAPHGREYRRRLAACADPAGAVTEIGAEIAENRKGACR